MDSVYGAESQLAEFLVAPFGVVLVIAACWNLVKALR